MKLSSKVFQFALGTILAAAGVVLISGKLDNSTQPNIAGAQAGLSYTADWDAQRLLTVDSTIIKGGNQTISDLPIGVAEWKVTGRQTGTPTILFTETWSVPTIDVTIRGGGAKEGTFTPGNWLFSFFAYQDEGSLANHISRYKVSSLSVLSDDNINLGAAPTFNANGNSIICGGPSPGTCLTTLGSYGWHRFFANNPIPIRYPFSVVSGGLMMPLKWTVNGTIN